jgi:hypothetical protein
MGQIGSASLQLTGSLYARVANTKLSASQGAVSFWYQPASAPASTDQGLLELTCNCRASDSLYLFTLNSVAYLTNGTSILGQVASSTLPWSAGAWSHFVLVWNRPAKTLALYVDGTSYISATIGALHPTPPHIRARARLLIPLTSMFH